MLKGHWKWKECNEQDTANETVGVVRSWGQLINNVVNNVVHSLSCAGPRDGQHIH